MVAALTVFVSFIWDVVPRLPDNGALLAQPAWLRQGRIHPHSGMPANQ